MWKARRTTGRTNAYGVKKIVRHTYNTQNGMSVKGGWWEMVAAAKKRDGGLCVPCVRKGRRTPMKEVHHIKPLSQGGLTVLSNLMCVCEECHNARHSHLFRARK